jgi:tetratricopeptide (TPR) repeat protein
MKSQKWTWKNVELPSDLSEGLALKFESGLLEAALASAREEEAGIGVIKLLVDLGELYSRLGMLQKGLEVDLRLVRMRPEESRFHYNLACSLSRLGQIDPAFEALETALRLGYDNYAHLRADRDLDNLKQDKRFLKLLKQIESSA